MKRTIALIALLTLLFALLVPSAAFAGKGGVPGKPGGEKVQKHATVSGDDEAPAVKGKGKDKPKAAEAEDADEAPEAPEAPEGEETEERAGVANALASIQANLTRMQADLDAGLRKQLPPGLVRVMAKFMSWLGMEPVDGEVPAVEEPTSTVEPTATVEPPVVEEPVIPEPPLFPAE